MVLSTKGTPSPSCSKLYEALCVSSCTSCGNFAAWINIITSCRVCYICLTTRESSQPTIPSLAKSVYGLDKSRILEFPRMKSEPSVYGARAPRKTYQKRQIWLDGEATYRAAIYSECQRLLHGPQCRKIMQAYVQQLSSISCERLADGFSLPLRSDSTTEKPISNASCAWYARHGMM